MMYWCVMLFRQGSGFSEISTVRVRHLDHTGDGELSDKISAISFVFKFGEILS